MIDVELREIVEQITRFKMLFVGRLDEIAVEIVHGTIDVGIQTRLADRLDLVGGSVDGFFLGAVSCGSRCSCVGN